MIDRGVADLLAVEQVRPVPRVGVGVHPLGLAGPRRLENDSFIALRAGASRPYGVVVIAGTGHVAAGRDPAGRTVRTLGLGPMYGDFGSATDVAEKAVRAVADAYTGRGPATSLSRLLPPPAGCAPGRPFSTTKAAWVYCGASRRDTVVTMRASVRRVSRSTRMRW